MSKQENLIEEFQKLDSWEEKYEKIIKLGKNLPAIDEKLKVETNKISGCQSRVWLIAELTSDNKLAFQAESDSMLVQGLLSMVLGIYSGLSPDEILKTSPDFIKQIGFDEYLSPTRSNGLSAVIKKIKTYALGYQLILSKK